MDSVRIYIHDCGSSKPTTWETGRLGGETLHLDQLDQGIIEALQRDGRRPYARIASELGMSEGAVRYRVQRLEESGILQVVGIADPLKIGFNTMALIGVRVEPGKLPAVTAELAKLPEASYVATVTGAFDVMVEVICRDPAHFRTFLTDGIHPIPGIRSAESFMILELHKLAYGWGVGDVKPAVRLLGDGDRKDAAAPTRR